MAASKLQALWNHPAGPKTIHFCAPTFKWGISIANVADFSKPPEKLSYPQQIGMITSQRQKLLQRKNDDENVLNFLLCAATSKPFFLSCLAIQHFSICYWFSALRWGFGYLSDL